MLPVYVGMTILDNSKVLMYGQSSTWGATEDMYEDMAVKAHLFDTSHKWLEEYPLHSGKKKRESAQQDERWVRGDINIRVHVFEAEDVFNQAWRKG